LEGKRRRKKCHPSKEDFQESAGKHTHSQRYSAFARIGGTQVEDVF